MSKLETVIDCNVKGGKSLVLPLVANEMLFTLYVFSETGSHNNHEIAVDISPNGTDFLPLVIIPGADKHITQRVAATHVRVSVNRGEGKTSTCKIVLVAA